MMGALLGDPARKSAAATRTAAPLDYLTPLIALGAVLTGAGVVDLGLAWVPFRFGVGEWEFGTISRTFDGLALTTIGLVLLTVGAVARRVRLALLALAIVFALALVVLVGMAALYALNAPIALTRVPLEAKQAMTRAVLRTSLFACLYLPLYGWLGWFTWRQYRTSHTGAGL